MYLKKRLSIIFIKIVRQINTHDLSKYSTCMYFSIRCSVYQCTFTMQLMYNYFYTLIILTISVSNVHLCTSSCSFFLIKSDIGFHYIENNVDESILYSKHLHKIFEHKMHFKTSQTVMIYTLQKRKFRIYDLQSSTLRFLLCLLLQKKFVTTWIPYHLKLKSY